VPFRSVGVLVVQLFIFDVALVEDETSVDSMSSAGVEEDEVFTLDYPMDSIIGFFSPLENSLHQILANQLLHQLKIPSLLRFHLLLMQLQQSSQAQSLQAQISKLMTPHSSGTISSGTDIQIILSNATESWQFDIQVNNLRLIGDVKIQNGSMN